MRKLFLLSSIISVFLIISISFIPSSQAYMAKEEIKNKIESYFSNLNKKINFIKYNFQSVFIPFFIIIYAWILGISIIFNFISTMISEKKIFLTIGEILNSIRLGFINSTFIFIPLILYFSLFLI